MMNQGDNAEPTAAVLRIGELARRVGMRPETLRAWERRYGLLAPERSSGGYRLYSAEDEARIRVMLGWIERGASPAEAARLTLDGQSPEPPIEIEAPELPVLERAADRLLEALVAFDDQGAQQLLDQAFARFSLDTALDELILPVLAELGKRWQQGKVTVGEEHFASELLRARLIGLGRGWGAGRGPLALLACPPGERHDLALVSFGLALRERSWRIAFLGADTPVATLMEAADELNPDAIVVAGVEPSHFDQARKGLRALAPRHRLLLAGAGANPQVARAAGAEYLEGPPVHAAAWLAGEEPAAG
jgi:MerR family transcriptional regulator, light-induced transcriptional regulator